MANQRFILNGLLNGPYTTVDVSEMNIQYYSRNTLVYGTWKVIGGVTTFTWTSTNPDTTDFCRILGWVAASDYDLQKTTSIEIPPQSAFNRMYVPLTEYGLPDLNRGVFIGQTTFKKKNKSDVFAITDAVLMNSLDAFISETNPEKLVVKSGTGTYRFLGYPIKPSTADDEYVTINIYYSYLFGQNKGQNSFDLFEDQVIFRGETKLLEKLEPTVSGYQGHRDPFDKQEKIGKQFDGSRTYITTYLGEGLDYDSNNILFSKCNAFEESNERWNQTQLIQKNYEWCAPPSWSEDVNENIYCKYSLPVSIETISNSREAYNYVKYIDFVIPHIVQRYQYQRHQLNDHSRSQHPIAFKISKFSGAEGVLSNYNIGTNDMLVIVPNQNICTISPTNTEIISNPNILNYNKVIPPTYIVRKNEHRGVIEYSQGDYLTLNMIADIELSENISYYQFIINQSYYTTSEEDNMDHIFGEPTSSILIRPKELYTGEEGIVSTSTSMSHADYSGSYEYYPYPDDPDPEIAGYHYTIWWYSRLNIGTFPLNLTMPTNTTRGTGGYEFKLNSGKDMANPFFNKDNWYDFSLTSLICYKPKFEFMIPSINFCITNKVNSSPVSYVESDLYMPWKATTKGEKVIPREGVNLFRREYLDFFPGYSVKKPGNVSGDMDYVLNPTFNDKVAEVYFTGEIAIKDEDGNWVQNRPMKALLLRKKDNTFYDFHNSFIENHSAAQGFFYALKTDESNNLKFYIPRGYKYQLKLYVPGIELLINEELDCPFSADANHTEPWYR